MELASKVIVVHHGIDGAGPRLANALHPTPSSQWKTIEMPLELPLDSYGITDVGVSGQIVNFVDSQGSPQASVILLQNYKAPNSACVSYEVLKFIRTKTSRHSSSLTVIFPCLTAIRKSSQKLRDLNHGDLEQSLYATEINEASDVAKEIVRGLKNLPPTVQILDDLLACMLHFARVLEVPSILLVAPIARIKCLNSNATIQDAEESQMFWKLGDLLASHMGIAFSKDLFENTPVEINKGAEDDWRRLYG